MSGLVTTRHLADRFANGMEYFATYGGSTVATAAALAVLRTIKEERWQEHAQQVCVCGGGGLSWDATKGWIDRISIYHGSHGYRRSSVSRVSR